MLLCVLTSAQRQPSCLLFDDLSPVIFAKKFLREVALTTFLKILIPKCIGIAKAFLLRVVQVILAHVEPYAATTQLLGTTIGEGERHPVLVLRMHWLAQGALFDNTPTAVGQRCQRESLRFCRSC